MKTILSGIRFLTTFIICLFSLNAISQCDRLRDSLVLVDLYIETKGDDWIRKNNWLSAAPLNTWHGVRTDADGCVTELNLSSNRLLGTLILNIVDLKMLRKLNFADNKLTLSGIFPFADSLPPGLGDLPFLEELNLSSNILGGPVTSELGNLPNLRVLNLSLNEFSKSIPSNLGNLKKLEKLFLNQNYLTGSIPPALGEMTNLNEMILSQNRLSGTIPAELGNLQNLAVISLTQNQISGQIPGALKTMPNLRYVYFNENQLSGEIPKEMGDIVNLTELWLMDNQLSGSIPAELGNASNLQKLLLNNNQLTGNIPEPIGNLTSLLSLHLSDNQLSGPIPENFGGLTRILSLLMGNNQLSGPIPATMGNLKELRNLDIHNNQLTGEIPEEFGGMINLRRIYFQNNQLIGCFPESMRKYCGLGYNDNINATGYNFLGNDNMVFEGNFTKWCVENYRVDSGFSSNAPLCEGNTLVLTPNNLNGTYIWTGPDGFQSTLQNPNRENFVFAMTGTYQLQVTDANGCRSTSTINVQGITEGNIDSNSPVCEGIAINLTADGGIGYQWTGPNNFSSTLQNPVIPNANKNMEGVYKLKILTQDCTIEKEVEISFIDFGEISSENSKCLGESLQLFASGGDSYLWTGPNNFISSLANPIVSSLSDANIGSYQVVISLNNGCKSTFSTDITYISPEVPILEPIADICQTSSIITLPKIQNDYFGSWSGKGVFIENGESFFDPRLQSGDVALIFTPDPSFNCVDDANASIFVHNLEVETFEIAPSINEENNNGAFNITIKGSGNSFFYEWNGPASGSGDTNSPKSIDINQVASGQYVVSVRDENGCLVIDTVEIKYLYSNYHYPNAVIKKGSNAKNSLFFVEGININSYDISVYDRWGSVVHHQQNLDANNAQDAWDISQSTLSAGVYIVILEIDLPLGKETAIQQLTIIE